MSESFTVIFSSRGNNVLNNTSLNSVVYNVNWSSFLPLEHKKFNCQFVFKSENSTTNLINVGYASMNLGKTTIFDGNSNTSNIGLIYPVINVTGVASYYSATVNDNNSFISNYPISNQITITLNNFAGAVLPNMANYCLILTMTPIQE